MKKMTSQKSAAENKNSRIEETAVKDINLLREKIKVFNRERDWEQYHSPKNFAIALSVEAAELLEIFTWLNEEQSINPDEKKLQNIKDEVGDIMLYLLNFCNRLDLDPVKCAFDKMKKNEKKYPSHLVKGKSQKYNEY